MQQQERNRFNLKATLVYALIAAQLSPAAWATDIADAPLITSNQAKPNIMFMLDNSGSMSNIVPEAASGYNETSPALTCPSGNRITAGSSVDLVISGSAAFARVGGTSYTFGVTGSQKCFDSAATYGARLLADSSGQPGSYLDADYKGHFLNWYFGSGWGTITSSTQKRPGTRTRMEIAKEAGKGIIDSLVEARAGLSTYNNGDGGTLLREVKDLDTTHQTNLRTGIDALVPSGNTPLAETLSDIGRYFARGYTGNLTLRPGKPTQSTASVANVFNNHEFALGSGAAITADPIQYGCQLSFAVLLTDGRPQGDQSMSDQLWDYTRDCASGLCLSTAKSGYGMKGSTSNYESAGSDFLDDVAAGLYDMDLRPNVTPDPTGRVTKRNVTTYAIGFADLQAQNDPLLRTAAIRGGGQFFASKDSLELAEAFEEIMVDIFSKDTSSAAVAVSNVNVKTGDNFSFATSFTSGVWSGDLVMTQIDTATGLPTGAQGWSAAAKLDALTNPVASRLIATHNGSTGIPFQWSSLTAAQQTSLNTPSRTPTDGADVLKFIRGDRTFETSAPAIVSPPTPARAARYRNRVSTLGDTVNAEPVYVKKPVVKWFSENGFSTYLSSSTVTSRPGMVYQAANDGMLHAFDAATGDEKWAYIPGLVVTNLQKLSKRVGFQHNYFVDGTPVVSEVADGAGNWKTILVGGLNKGGRGFYALDITSPAASSEADVAAKVLWEFPAAGSALAKNVGFSFGQPIIAKTRSGQWVAIVTSGYNNGADTLGDGQGHVFVLNALTGAVIADIKAFTGTDNTDNGSSTTPSGLVHLTPFVRNYERNPVLDYLYGGDLMGNVWRVDLSSPVTTNWKMLKVARVVDPSGNFQPITTPPELTLVNDKPVIAIGTGQYLGKSDISGTGTTPNVHATQTQSMYGLLDDLSATPLIKGTTNMREKLLERTVTETGMQRTITPKAPDTVATSAYGSGKRGWVFNFITTQERLAVAPQLALGTLVFPSSIPSGIVCESGGSSWLYNVSIETGLTSIDSDPNTPKVEFIGKTLSSRASFISVVAGKVQALFRIADVVIPPGHTLRSTTVTSIPVSAGGPAAGGTTTVEVWSNDKTTTVVTIVRDASGNVIGKEGVLGQKVPQMTNPSPVNRKSWREVPR